METTQMKIGIAIEETWSFFTEIYADLQEHHQVSLFETKAFNLPIYRERLNNYLFRKNLYSTLKSNQVVFFEWASHLLSIATDLPKTCGIITRLHRYEMYNWIDKVNWERVDKIILVTNAKKQRFSKILPEQESKIVVIPEAVSLSKFQSERKKYNGDIGILCHLTPRKRVYELILTFYELSKLHNDLHLHIGGGEHPRFKDYYEALYSLVEKLNLGDKVTFYGNITKPEDWYPKVDIFISNSYSEGLQVSPMEAIASGCYCLSHHWDGADELFPPEYLYFTSQELIKKILCYIDRSENGKLAQIEFLQSIVRDNFDIHKIKVKIRELIEEVGAKYS